MREGAFPRIAHFCSLRNITANQLAAIIPRSPQHDLFLLRIEFQLGFLQFAFFQVGTCTVVFQPFFNLSWIASYHFPVYNSVHSLSRCSTDVSNISCKKKIRSIYMQTIRTPRCLQQMTTFVQHTRSSSIPPLLLYLFSKTQNTTKGLTKLFKRMHPNHKSQKSSPMDFTTVLLTLFCMGKPPLSPLRLLLQQHRDTLVDRAYFHEFIIQSLGMETGCSPQNMLP